VYNQEQIYSTEYNEDGSTQRGINTTRDKVSYANSVVVTTQY